MERLPQHDNNNRKQNTKNMHYITFPAMLRTMFIGFRRVSYQILISLVHEMARCRTCAKSYSTKIAHHLQTTHFNHLLWLSWQTLCVLVGCSWTFCLWYMYVYTTHGGMFSCFFNSKSIIYTPVPSVSSPVEIVLAQSRLVFVPGVWYHTTSTSPFLTDGSWPSG